MNKPWLNILAGIIWLTAVVISVMNYSEQILLNGFWRGFFYTLGAIGPIVVLVVYAYLKSSKNEVQHG